MIPYMPYLYKGASTIIPAVTGDFCLACDEVVLDVAESTRTSATILEFNKQVNAAIVEPGFIEHVRKNLRLTNAKLSRFSAVALMPFHVTS